MESNMTYRRIAIDWLKIADYQIQRLNIRRAKAIAESFDDTKLGVLTVSKRDGVYYVVDGQHRYAAAKMAGRKDMMCAVLEGLTYEDECMMFATQDENCKPVIASHKFNAMIEGKDQKALKIRGVVESAGLELICGHSKSQNQIIAVSTIQAIFKQHGEAHLHRVCKLVKDTWRGVPESLNKHIINGVSIFLKYYSSEVDEKRFLAQLSKIDPPVIIREGNSDISCAISDNCIRYAKVLWKYYNRGAAEKRRLTSKF